MRTYREMTVVTLEDTNGSVVLSDIDLADASIPDLEPALKSSLRRSDAGTLRDQALEDAVVQIMALVMTNEAIPGAREDKPVVTSANAQWDEQRTIKVERRLETEF